MQDNIFKWALNGYQGQPPEEYYFDENGQSRPKLTVEDEEYTKRKVDDTSGAGGNEVKMGEAPPLPPELPADLSPYQKQWDLAKPALKNLLSDPKVHAAKEHKTQKMLRSINAKLRGMQLEDKIGVDLAVPADEMLYTLVVCAEELVKHKRAESEKREDDARTHKGNADRPLGVFETKINLVQQPSEWIELLKKNIKRKAELLSKNIANRDRIEGLWKEGFLEDLGGKPSASTNETSSAGAHEPSSDPSNENQPRAEEDSMLNPSNSDQPRAEGDSTSSPHRLFSRDAQSNQSRSATQDSSSDQDPPQSKTTSKKRSAFTAGQKEGSHRLQRYCDSVLWKKKYRAIGGVLRRATPVSRKELKGRPSGMPLAEPWQVLLQANPEKNPKFPVWWLVAASDLDTDVIALYQEEHPDPVNVHDMKGTKQDLDGKPWRELEIEGVAFIPRQTDNYSRKSEQLVKASFYGKESKFWTKSALAARYCDGPVQGLLDRFYKEAGVKPPIEPAYKEIRARNRGKRTPSRHTRRARRDLSDSDDDSDYMLGSDTEYSLSQSSDGSEGEYSESEPPSPVSRRRDRHHRSSRRERRTKSRHRSRERSTESSRGRDQEDSSSGSSEDDRSDSYRNRSIERARKGRHRASSRSKPSRRSKRESSKWGKPSSRGDRGESSASDSSDYEVPRRKLRTSSRHRASERHNIARTSRKR